MKHGNQLRKVHERWRLRNGSIVMIEYRMGDAAAGCFEGTRTPHGWEGGRSATGGGGYDLVEQLPIPAEVSQ